jgi:hypothetical protein
VKRRTITRNAAAPTALLVLIAALVPLAHASVQVTGVLSTGSHAVVVDTVLIMNVGGGMDLFTSPVLDWRGDSMTVDTFVFPPIAFAPLQVDMWLTVDSSPIFFSISGPQQDTWYVIPGTPTEAQVMFSWQDIMGVDEYGRPARRRAVLSVRPSVVGARASIRAERVAGTNCAFEFYDVAGNRVRTLRTQASSSGAASATWSGEDDLGRRLPEGIYYCCLDDAANPSVRKLVLTR